MRRCASEFMEAFVVCHFGPSGWCFIDPDFKLHASNVKFVREPVRFFLLFYYYISIILYIALCHYKLCIALICAHCTQICRLAFPFFTFLYRFVSILARFSLFFRCCWCCPCIRFNFYIFFSLLFISFAHSTQFHFISFDCLFFIPFCFFFFASLCNWWQTTPIFSVGVVLCMHAYRQENICRWPCKQRHNTLFSFRYPTKRCKSHFVCSFGFSSFRCVFFFLSSLVHISFSRFNFNSSENERHIFEMKHNAMEELNSRERESVRECDRERNKDEQRAWLPFLYIYDSLKTSNQSIRIFYVLSAQCLRHHLAE